MPSRCEHCSPWETFPKRDRPGLLRLKSNSYDAEDLVAEFCQLSEQKSQQGLPYTMLEMNAMELWKELYHLTK